MMRFTIFILFFAFSFPYVAFPQDVVRDTSVLINNSSVSHSLQMNGSLDGENTLSRDPYTRVFEPMVQIKMTNKGNQKISNPQLVFNNRGRWFTIDQMRSECFNGAVTEKDKALSLWKFFRDNRIHDFAPETADNVNDPMKLLAVYGYGMCYNTNYSMCFLSSPLQVSGYHGYSPQGLHYVSELNFGTGYAHIDSDIETFYLKSDNVTLASSQEAFSDRHLIRRTHHYGNQKILNPQVSNYVANLYYKKDAHYFFGYIKEQNFHKLNFTLRPGESITYDWTLPEKRFGSKISEDLEILKNSPAGLVTEPDLIRAQYFSKPKKNNPSLLSAKEEVSANGYFDYQVRFSDVSLAEVLDSYSNVSVSAEHESGPRLYIQEGQHTAEAVVKVESPFVIVDGYLKGNFFCADSADMIKIFWSKDEVSWTEIKQISGTGAIKDSTDLGSLIGSQSAALYKYYIKYTMSTSGTQARSCGLDSLQVYTEFQVSKFFLPQLHLGINTIEYADSNLEGRDLQLEIKWKETTSNNPPDQIAGPTFPQDNSIVNNLKFTFTWPAAVDNDGDNIVDYEFQLSDRSDMKFPLSPTFEGYTDSADGIQAISSFAIPGEGLLNDGTTYYWRVRAKDSRGAWGTWSPVWSFVPKGAMPPLNVSASFPGDSIRIAWQKNTGDDPLYYEIYGSNEWLGFSPGSSTLIGTSGQTHFDIKRSSKNKLFYRIVAVSASGKKSGPSDVLELPYPHMAIKADPVSPGQVYNLNASPAPLTYTRVDPQKAIIALHTDSFAVNVITFPPWLSAAADDQVSGFADSAVAFALLADSSNGRVAAQYVSSFTGNSKTMDFYLESAYSNTDPSIEKLNMAIIAGVSYADTIEVSDKDFIHGDSIVSVTSVHPHWMTLHQYHNKVIISGTPVMADVGDTSISISVTDVIGGTTVQTNPIRVEAPLKASFVFNSGGCSPYVAFTDSSRAIVPGDSIISWKWHFGDSLESDDQYPVHIYSAPSSYLVKLIVSTAMGYVDTIARTLDIYPAPAASFSSGFCANDSFCFVNSSSISSGSIISWSWDFGDGQISTLRNPVHYYDSTALYLVTLRAVSDFGCVNTTRDSILVVLPVSGVFSYGGGNCSSLVHFDDLSQAPAGDRITGWNWNFGDGAAGVTQDPLHTYSSPGRFPVELIITSIFGAVDTVRDTVEVFPTPEPGFSSVSCSRDSLCFTDYSAITGDSIVSWLWDFGNGVQCTLHHPTYHYDSTAAYAVNLRVTSSQGCSASVTDTVLAVLPASPAFMYTGGECSPVVQFKDFSRAARGDAIAAWKWIFGDASTSAEQSPAHMYKQAGTFPVKLIITTAFGASDTLTDTVRVFSRPVADFSAVKCSDDSMCFSDRSYISSGSISSWFWDFGDGTAGFTSAPIHRYSSAGYYAVSLQVTTSNGCVNMVTDTVKAVLPIAGSFGFAGGECSPAVQFGDHSIAAAGDVLVSWLWDFGDATVASGQNPLHTYRSPGAFPVKLVVSSAFGAVSTLRDTVRIFAVPAAGFSSFNCVMDSVCFFDNSVINNGGIVAWLWDFGDQTVSVLENPVHHYDSPGVYVVALSVSSKDGCASSFSDTVSVLKIPHAQVAPPVTGLVAYPNPFTRAFSFRLTEEMSGADLQLYDALGQLVYSEQLDGNAVMKEINAQQLPEGLYHLYIRTPERQWKASVQKVH